VITLKWHSDKWLDKWRKENPVDQSGVASSPAAQRKINRVGDYRDMSGVNGKENLQQQQIKGENWKHRLANWLSVTGFYFFLFASAYFVISIFIYGFILSFLLLFS
jgi:hypothetical protein